MKEVKEEEGLLEREASSLVRLTKPTSNFRHIGNFLQKRPKIKFFEIKKDCVFIFWAIICEYLMFLVDLN